MPRPNICRTRTASGRAKRLVTLLGLAALLLGALGMPPPAAAQDSAGPALDSLTRARIDGLSADAGTPAFVDGFAGLLVIDPRRARPRPRAGDGALCRPARPGTRGRRCACSR